MLTSQRRSRYGQSSLEFVAMMSLALVLFAGFFTFFADRQATAANIQQDNMAVSVAEKVAFELDLALTQGDGFSRVFELRDDISGEPYTLTLRNETVLLEYEDADILATTAARGVEGEVQPGTNKVKNRGGRLYVTQP